jgi:hypothetical protein
MHDGDSSQARRRQSADDFLEGVAVAEIGQCAEGAVSSVIGLTPSQTGSPVSAAACTARLP